jgi:hypothetical protein
MASNKARDSRLSPRAMLMWLVITMQPVSPSQSANISQTQSKQRADSSILDAPLAHIPSMAGRTCRATRGSPYQQSDALRRHERTAVLSPETANLHAALGKGEQPLLPSYFQYGLTLWFEIKVDAQQGLPGDNRWRGKGMPG